MCCLHRAEQFIWSIGVHDLMPHVDTIPKMVLATCSRLQAFEQTHPHEPARLNGRKVVHLSFSPSFIAWLPFLVWQTTLAWTCLCEQMLADQTI